MMTRMIVGFYNFNLEYLLVSMKCVLCLFVCMVLNNYEIHLFTSPKQK